MLVEEARAAFKEAGDVVFREREQLVVNLLQVSPRPSEGETTLKDMRTFT